jgi:hypothetical protein
MIGAETPFSGRGTATRTGGVGDDDAAPETAGVAPARLDPDMAMEACVSAGTASAGIGCSVLERKGGADGISVSAAANSGTAAATVRFRGSAAASNEVASDGEIAATVSSRS